MAQSRSTHLDRHLFEQALGVLERERPSRLEDRLFRFLNQLVWGALALTALYLLLLWPFGLGQDAARPVARAAALLYILVIPVFLLNWRLVNKLRRAARWRRRLAPTWQSRLMQQFSIRRGQRWLYNLPTLVLSVVLGYPATLVGLVGLFFELIRDPIDRARLTVAVAIAVFGLSCIFLHFIARGRERLAVLADLTASLLGSRSAANEGLLTNEQYDEIIKIERAQIVTDRRRSLQAATGESVLSRIVRALLFWRKPSRQAPDVKYASKESRSVREAKKALAPAVLSRVQACIDRLTSAPRAEARNTQARDGVSYIRVPDTLLELGFTVDWEGREIRLLSLGSTGGAQAADPRGD
jgi:hypothetical protein